MKEFLIKRYLTIDLLLLLVGGGILSFLVYLAQLEADSENQESGRAPIRAFVAGASFVLAYIIVYSRERWFEFIPNWVILAIFGAFMNSLINFGALVVYWDSPTAPHYLTALYGRLNPIISSTIFFSLVLLTVFSFLKIITYAVQYLMRLR